MDTKKEQLLQETHKSFFNLMLEDFPLDRMEEFIVEDVSGYGTTLDEKIMDISRLRKVVIDQREQGAGMDMHYTITPVKRRISPAGDMALFIDEVEISMVIDGDKNLLPLRLSTIFEFRSNNWKVAHLHGSMAVATEGDTWHKDEWKRKNEALQKIVEEKTTDLLVKNRELEIEAALERVRSRTMAMKHSEELSDTSFVLFQQFTELGIVPNHFFIGIVNEEEGIFDIWLTEWGGELSSQNFRVNVEEPVLVKKIYEAWKRKEKSIEVDINGEDIVKWNKYLEGVGLSVKNRKSVSRLVNSCAIFSKGVIAITTPEIVASETIQTLERFATVFDGTYTRFLDLQKAESQAREGQIELALERVRARTMAMQKSDELQEVVLEVFERLRELDISMDAANINIFSEGSRNAELWVASPGQKYASCFHLPYVDYAIPSDIFNAKENGEVFFKNIYSFEDKNKYFNYLFEHSDFKFLPDNRKNAMLAGAAYAVSFAFANTAAISIHNYSGIPLSDPENDILKRFAKVFEQTYTRFLDLQKAEAQAREAHIEMALERVRARTMAMHNSDELGEVAAMLFEQISLLRDTPERFNIAIVNEESETFDIWVTDQEGHQVRKAFIFEVTKSPVVSEVFKAWQQKEESIVQDLHGDSLKKWIRYFSGEVGLPFNEEQIKEHRYINSIFFSHGCIGITTNEAPKPEDLRLIERFAKVFQQTYTRFLDLKKAETQAREAQIETALERVRAKSLAMHSTSELQEVVNIVAQQLHNVEMDVTGVFIAINNQEVDKEFAFWGSSGVAETYLKRAAIPFLDRPIYTVLAKAIRNRDGFFTEEYAREEKVEFFKHMFKHPPYNSSTPEWKNQVLSREGGYTRSVSVSHYTTIFVVNHHGRQLSDADNEILKRFGKVFEQSYIRFLDLQKAEKQFREAQIEAALERIRARAMAMQHTEELNEVIGLLCEQYDILGINPVCAHLSLIDLENNRFSLRLSGKKGARNIGEKIIDLNAMQEWAESVVKWKKSEPQSYQCLVYPPEAIPTLMEVLGDLIATMPEESRISAADFPNGNFSCEGQNKFGYLGFNHSRPPTDEEIQIVMRFAREFERIYQRFLDLEKAEVQAREAIKQASLDRVRGEIASMRTKDDLNRITPLIWKELNAMGVPFIRCGVLIMDVNREIIHTYLSEPDGRALSAFELGFDSEEIGIGAVKHWRKNGIFYLHWDKNQFVHFMQNLIKDGKVDVPESYHGSAPPPESLYLNFLPFTQGMIYVGNVSPLADDKIQLIKALADAFSIAYARYEDFNKLEKANQDIEATLTELKATQSQLIQAEKMASLGELTAGIAHEIQNPLNFVNNFSDVNKELIAEMKEVLRNGNIEDVNELVNDIESNEEKINHHGKRAEAIVKGMLQHSRSSSGVKEPTNLNALCDEYLRLSYHGLRARDKSFNATIKTEFDESIGKINIIPQDFGRVVLNLITNAFYAVNEKSKENQSEPVEAGYKPLVVVSTKRLNDTIELSVKDNGNGIPESIKEKIFQPFFTTKPTGQGTGLGLSLSYDIIKAHGGDIKVESKEGDGSKFIINIPTTH